MKFCLILMSMLLCTFIFGQNITPKKKGSKYIYVDKEGNKAFDQKFEDAARFYNDRAAVKNKGLWGFIDSLGNPIIPFEYDQVHKFIYDRVIAVKKNTYFLLDQEGKTISSNTDTISYIAPDLYSYRHENLYGIIDKNGEKLSDPAYSYVGEFYKGLVTVKRDGKWINWSKEGEVTENPQLLFTEPQVFPIFSKECSLKQFPDQQKACSNEQFLSFIYNNVRYPSEAVKLGIEGMTVIQFIITTEGKVTEANIVRSLVGGLDREALKTVELIGSWEKPAFHEGIPVNMLFTLPVRFKLK